jgi:DNA polymerase-3 subunit gamma/tau
VVELGEDALRFQLAPGMAQDIAPELREALHKLTGRRWQVERARPDEAGEPALREQAEALAAAAQAELAQHPLVQAAFAHFPGAEILDDPAAPDTVTPWSRRA